MKKLTVALVLCLVLAAQVWGYAVTLTHTTVNVAATSTTVLAANVNRTTLIVVNDSDVDMYCKFGVAAVANQGLRINAAGGTLYMDLAVDRHALYCIHGGIGNKVVTVAEGVQG